MPMLLTKRLAAMVAITLVLVAAVFALQQASPLDPVHAMLGAQASEQAIEAQRHLLGLDRPLPVQFWHYITGLLHGDFGNSYRTRRPVADDLAVRLPATAELAVFALALALVLAVILAFGTTLRWPGAGLFRLILIVGASTPAFLLGIAAILVFYQKLGWLPATGRSDYPDAPTGPTGMLVLDGLFAGRPSVSVDALRHLLLPGLALAVGPAVSIGRVLRSSLIGNEASDYVRTARAKGLTERRILRSHLLRNSLGPALSMTGLQIGLMFAGVLVIEQVFSWPGVGQYTAQSISTADFPAITGVTLVLGVGYVVVNTIVDVLQSVADPRIHV